MKFSRRQFLQLTAGAPATAVYPLDALALDYPTRPARLIVGFPAASGPDIVARLLGQWLSDRLGQPFVIENMTGAGGNIAVEAVVRAPPDGYTLLFVISASAWNAWIYDNLNFDFTRDITPVATIDTTPFVMEVNPSFPAQTISEFIEYGKANPGKINMATAGVGSGPHVYGALFAMMAGVDMVPVHYRSNPLPDLLSGQVQVYFGPISASIGYIRAKKLRALAVTGATRSDALPDVPTVGETVPGYETNGWVGIGAPNGTPAEIVDELNKQINAALADPKFIGRLADLGATPLSSSPDQFRKLIADETKKWAKVIKFANIKPG